MTFYLWRTGWSTYEKIPQHSQAGSTKFLIDGAYGCSLCSSIPARGAHERYVAAARVHAESLESSEPFEVSADGWIRTAQCLSMRMG